VRLAAGALCFALVACGAAPPAPLPPSGDNAAQSADEGPREDDLRLTLVEPGAAPRRELRYRYPIGKAEPIEIAMKMTITIVNGEAAPGAAAPPTTKAELPTIKTQIRIDPLGVSPAGDLKYEFHVVKTSVDGDVPIPPELREKLEAELGRMNGTGGWALVSPRGLVKRSVYEIPRDAPPEVAQTMESLRQAMQQLATPFPAEAVGVGARWETVSSVKTQLVKMTQTTRYQIAEWTGDRGTLKIEVSQVAPPQQVQMPATPPGVTWNLESLTTNGTGNARFDLTKVAPLSDTQVHTRTALRAEKDGQAQRLVTEVDMTVGLRAAK